LTTHYMDEADYLCDRVAIIDHGTIIAMYSPGALKRRLPHERVYRLELKETNGAVRLKDMSLEAAEVEEQRAETTGTLPLALTQDQPERAQPALGRGLAQSGASVINCSVKEPTLEDVFISRTGRALRDSREVGSWGLPDGW